MSEQLKAKTLPLPIWFVSVDCTKSMQASVYKDGRFSIEFPSETAARDYVAKENPESGMTLHAYSVPASV